MIQQIKGHPIPQQYHAAIDQATERLKEPVSTIWDLTSEISRESIIIKTGNFKIKIERR